MPKSASVAMHASARRAFGALAAAALVAGCGADPQAKRALDLAECRLPRLATAAQCGTVTVPEDRSKPDGRKLGIFVAVLPANTLTPDRDPFVILAGGPGQAASSLAPFAARLNEIRRTRDVVLVDQRGTGRSSPLACKAFSAAEMKEAAFETDPGPRAKRCAEELAQAGVDASQYTTAAFVDDLEAVRVALGAERWNLWGGSYGTRAAQEYLRRHPARVRTMVLDGVAAPSMAISLDVWTSRERALDALFARCRASPSCAQALPDPPAALDAVRRDWSAPGRVLEVVDPATGRVDRVPSSGDGAYALLQTLLYSPETTALIPALILRARAGDPAPLVAATTAFTADLAESMNVALHYSVTCAEDVPRIGADALGRGLDGSRAQRLARAVIAVCDVWPRGRAPADAATPVTSSVPTLLLSGGLDPVTPPSAAEEVAKTLSSHKHVVAAGYGHIVSPHACAPRLLASFVDAAGFGKLPEDCVKRLETSVAPPLWSGTLGPSMP